MVDSTYNPCHGARRGFARDVSDVPEAAATANGSTSRHYLVTTQTVNAQLHVLQASPASARRQLAIPSPF
ncbi:hypothetical protein TgHK011_004286 [Trichoderma gracile]|nr:hypothetical protein TgHK011_004286 [Trichoderma gracile]